MVRFYVIVVNLVMQEDQDIDEPLFLDDFSDIEIMEIIPSQKSDIEKDKSEGEESDDEMDVLREMDGF